MMALNQKLTLELIQCHHFQQQGRWKPDHLRDISWEGLTPHRNKDALKLLIEQQDAFARDNSDVGSVPDLQLKINVKDASPVQKYYVAVPRPLYPEVKSYIEDVLNHQFIRKSSSP